MKTRSDIFPLFIGVTCDTSDWRPPSNGQISSPCNSNSQVQSGTYCAVTCNHGFKINGASRSVCGSNGEWTPRTTANCQGRKEVQVTEMFLLSFVKLGTIQMELRSTTSIPKKIATLHFSILSRLRITNTGTQLANLFG